MEGVLLEREADVPTTAPRTVGHHVSSIPRKLGVKTRGQAVAEAARLGLLSGPQ
jgi:DNA-binding NarL/FixJ family response regulator